MTNEPFYVYSIDWLKNLEVYLECIHLVFLTTLVVLLDKRYLSKITLKNLAEILLFGIPILNLDFK